MASKLLCVHLRGKEHRWSFEFYGDPKYLEEWRADGLEVTEILNTIPKWAVDIGVPVRWWFFAQDILNFNNPWRKD